ncbi:hypothetical protein EG329_013011 [Mollisiaceae sp. DMI_Dod_QoI]|nr:hypothetical protein EG329_013011 [Helotiales sp. DMI_Dod_QoI]
MGMYQSSKRDGITHRSIEGKRFGVFRVDLLLGSHVRVQYRSYCQLFEDLGECFEIQEDAVSQEMMEVEIDDGAALPIMDPGLPKVAVMKDLDQTFRDFWREYELGTADG